MDVQNPEQNHGGIVLQSQDASGHAQAVQHFQAWLEALGLSAHVRFAQSAPNTHRFWMEADWVRTWAPAFDTTQLCARLGLDTENNAHDLEREILYALLLGPVPFVYPSWDELAAAVRVRSNIVRAARRTALAFHTTKIERPTDCWIYTEGRGFTVLPGVPLCDALRKASQPADGAEQYAFSCYRATEYVILLGIAEELAHSNPALLQDLQRYWESRAIMSGQFHEVFLREYGAMEQPLPPRYYVPGDRLWFRNPDEASSDVSGYEGSWVFYMGGGLFSNFWNRAQPYTLTAKCVEIFHWRHGTYLDAEGELRMDEAVVAERVHATLQDPQQLAQVLQQMLRLREPKGVYVAGGCIDTTREYPRGVCPQTTDLRLPLP